MLRDLVSVYEYEGIIDGDNQSTENVVVADALE
jgi:hypothetical protein